MGNVANGNLTIEGGTTVSVDLFLGYQATGAGTATVSGANSTLSGSAAVGYAGMGTLNILSGGTYSVNASVSSLIYGLAIGNSSDGTGTVNVSGANSNITVYSGLGIDVGAGGTGTLHVSNNGLINLAGTSGSPGSLYIAEYGGQGSINVASGATITGAHGVYLGAGGPGVMSITAGGVVNDYLGAVGSASNSPSPLTARLAVDEHLERHPHSRRGFREPLSRRRE